MVLESLYIIIDKVSYYLKVSSSFWFNGYLLMYAVMILMNGLFLACIYKYKDTRELAAHKRKQLEHVEIIYATMMMTWGSVISLMDQKLYGELIAFMVNMITCSVLFYLSNKQILIPYFCSVLVLAIGLPFFQTSENILIGHYFNLFIFVLISWIASRLIYIEYCKTFRGQVLLRQANVLLEKEAQENKDINLKLSLANFHLNKLTLLDELTNIPNRRCFRHYIDMAFSRFSESAFALSIMMIDIDYFKQYNDQYGHEAGDRALYLVANQINSIVKGPLEFVGRWGGEEFIYAAVNQDKETVAKKADEIQQKVRNLDIPHGFSRNGGSVSVSIGTSTVFIERKEDIRRAIALADKAMYQAKNSGRNCIRNIEKDAPEL
ncbi:MAG: GGDEF domain-containing protein [Oscillospiraceae bacterium]|nr:GGDEF domain-containing protein [Oscillospiraceae bacterium]